MSALILSLRSRGAVVEAGLHDAPLVRAAGPASTTVPVNAGISPDDNRVTARISPWEGAASRAAVDLAVGFDDAPEPLVRFVWRAATEDFEPFAVELPLALPEDASTTDLWRFVRPNADDAAIEAARRFGADVATIFARRDAEVAAGLMAFRTRETARAFGLDEGQLVRDVRRQFGALLANGAEVLSIDRDAVRVTPCAGDRVLYLSRDDGGELVEVRTATGGSSMQVYVAEIDGRWTVVR